MDSLQKTLCRKVNRHFLPRKEYIVLCVCLRREMKGEMKKKISAKSNNEVDYLPFSFKCQQVLFVCWKIVADGKTRVTGTQRMLFME